MTISGQNQEGNALGKLKELDQQVQKLAFTDINKTKVLLLEMRGLLAKNPNPDIQYSYESIRGFIENQLYNYQSSIVSFKQALKILEDHGDIQQRIATLIDLSATYSNIEDYELTDDVLEEARKLLKAFPNKMLGARLLCLKGYSNLHYNNLGASLELFLEAEKILSEDFDYLKLKDYYYLSLIYNGLGLVYSGSEEPGKAVRAYLAGVNLCETVGMKSRMSWHYLSVGNAYMAIEDWANAQEFFEKAIAVKDDSSMLSRALAYGNIGKLALQQKDLKKALSLFDKAEFIYQSDYSTDYGNFARLNYWRGLLYSELEKNNKALSHFEKAYRQATKVQDYGQLMLITKELVNYYAGQGDYENAHNHQLLYETFHQNRLEEIKERRTLELDALYESDKRQRESDRLKLQATKLQLKALRAQMNPHFMHNALNAIQNYITSGDVKNAASYLARFSELMRKSLDFSDLEFISLEEEIDFLNEYLSLNQKLRFENNLNFEISVHDDVEEDIVGVPTMIIQPYVENAIEHGIRRIQNGTIKVIFRMHGENTLLCTIEDDGIGRDEVKKIQAEDPKFKNHRSRGTKITEDRLRILFNVPENESFVKIRDLKDLKGKGCGTKVEIQIPITEINLVAQENNDLSSL